MTKAAEYMSRTKIGAYFHETRESRKLVLVIVAIALLLDNMLLTTVVPIIPEFLYTIRHQNDLKNGTMVQNPVTERPERLELETHNPDVPIDYNDEYHGRNSLETTTPENLDMYELEAGEKRRKKREDISLIRTKRSRSSNLYQHHRLTAEERKHKELIDENIEVGVMFASKAVVQLIANPFVGPLTNRIGYEVPMFCGFIIMFLSTIIFAFSRSYFILFCARALQGIGSSFSSVSGMGMLADRYPDDKERGNAMGIALGGLALGVLIGPPFGGFMYQFVGKSAPFIILAFLALFDGALQLLVLQPTITRRDEDCPSLKSLISDPYILIASGAITFANMGIAMLEPSLPIYMMDRMNAEKWQLGAAFLPASISYLIGTNLFGPLGHKIGRWLASLIGMYVIGLALILVPFASAPNHLIIPMAALGFGIGMVDSSMMPELGNLVDLRHGSVYGGVYAIGDIAFCLGFAVGPALSGSLVQGIGFEKMLIGIAIICFLYGPMLCALKDVPPKTDQEKQESSQLMEGGCTNTKVKYANFDDQLLQEPPYLETGERKMN